jgi:hypothetical protein
MILRFISLLLGESLCLSRSPTPIHALAKPRISLIVEVSMTESDKFIVRTRGQSPLKKGGTGDV